MSSHDSPERDRTTTDADRTERLVERLVDDAAASLGLFSTYLGDRLGYYDALAGASPATAADLAAATGTDERYAREWLEHQTVLGILAVEDADAPAAERRFSLPAAHAEVVTDPDSPNHAVPLAQLVAGAVKPLERVVEAYRTGAGVPFEEYGRDLREGQARINRPTFRSALGAEWIPTMPDVDERLRRDGARVADVGCGYGWSAIGLADAYESVRVDGYDVDEASVEAARETVAEAGVADRVTIHHRDVTDTDIRGDYDLVTAFECVHDMSDPVGALRTMRRLAAEDGTVLVVDERVGETFTETGTDVEPLMYGWSVLHCLPVGRVEGPSAATGTVMRPGTLREYAEAAGFSGFEVLPVEDFFLRLYRLTP